MKSCSTCNRTYDDDSLNFCLADGAPLTPINSEATVVIPRPVERKKGRLLIWLGLAVLAIGAGVVVLAAFLLFRYSGTSDLVTGSSQNTPNRQTTTSSPKPKPSPSPIPTSDTNEEDGVGNTTPTPENEISEEVTPIGWETTAVGFKGEPGQTYTFECPADGSNNAIFGSDIYTDYSSICTAAVHMGIIKLTDGGIVTLEYRPGRPIYGSTVRNDVKSNTASESLRSFIIRKKGASKN